MLTFVKVWAAVLALALEQSPGVSKASNKCRTGAGSCRKCTSRVYPPTLKRLKKKHLPGVEVLESCQSVKAGSYFFVSSVCALSLSFFAKCLAITSIISALKSLSLSNAAVISPHIFSSMSL